MKLRKTLTLAILNCLACVGLLGCADCTNQGDPYDKIILQDEAIPGLKIGESKSKGRDWILGLGEDGKPQRISGVSQYPIQYPVLLDGEHPGRALYLLAPSVDAAIRAAEIHRLRINRVWRPGSIEGPCPGERCWSHERGILVQTGTLCFSVSTRGGRWSMEKGAEYEKDKAQWRFIHQLATVIVENHRRAKLPREDRTVSRLLPRDAFSEISCLSRFPRALSLPGLQLYDDGFLSWSEGFVDRAAYPRDPVYVQCSRGLEPLVEICISYASQAEMPEGRYEPYRGWTYLRHDRLLSELDITGKVGPCPGDECFYAEVASFWLTALLVRVGDSQIHVSYLDTNRELRPDTHPSVQRLNQLLNIATTAVKYYQETLSDELRLAQTPPPHPATTQATSTATW